MIGLQHSEVRALTWASTGTNTLCAHVHVTDTGCVAERSITEYKRFRKSAIQEAASSILTVWVSMFSRPLRSHSHTTHSKQKRQTPAHLAPSQCGHKGQFRPDLSCAVHPGSLLLIRSASVLSSSLSSSTGAGVLLSLALCAFLLLLCETLLAESSGPISLLRSS